MTSRTSFAESKILSISCASWVVTSASPAASGAAPSVLRETSAHVDLPPPKVAGSPDDEVRERHERTAASPPVSGR